MFTNLGLATKMVDMIEKDSDDRTRFLLKLYRKALRLSGNELYKFFLDHAVKVTESKIGFFHFVNPDQQTISLTTWNKEALRDCTANYTTHYPLEQAGNWADCIRLKAPVIYNDFAQSPNQKGLPQGHVSIKRMLSLPIVEDGVPLAIFGVGNKTDPYDEGDIIQLNLVANELSKIIKQRRAEEKVAEANQRFEAHIANSPLAVVEFDSNYRVIRWSKRAEEMFGWSSEEVLGKAIGELHWVHEDDVQSVEENSDAMSEGKARSNLNVNRNYRKDGSVIWCEWYNSAIYDKQGKLISVLSSILDITKRKKAEEALHKSEQRWATTVSSIGDAVITTDLEGKVTFLNNVAEGLTGWSLAEAAQKSLETVFNIINSETRKKVESPVSRVLKEGKVVGLANHTILIRKNSTEVPIDDSGAPIIDKEGKTTGVVLVFRDITERRKAETVFQQERKLFFDVLETVPGMVCLLTSDYHVAFANRAFKEKFGESDGRHCYEYCFGKKEPCSFCESYKVLETGKPHHWEVKDPDGSVIDVRDFPFTDTDGSLMILEFDLDITEHRRIETQVQEYATRMEELAAERARKLKEAERLAAIGATAGMVGHDIRNPLQSIMGDVFLVKSDVSALPENEEKKSLSESLESISANVEYINKIVQDLQDFTRPIAPAIQETDLQDLCEEVLFKNGLPDNIEGTYRVEKNARRQVTDPTLLKRCVANLISNSVQAMPEGGKLCLHAYKEENDTLITVEDTGCGIHENVAPNLFMPLFTTKSKGQGFGLAVVKRVTEALGGTVAYESEVGKGTKFILRLPPKKK